MKGLPSSFVGDIASSRVWRAVGLLAARPLIRRVGVSPDHLIFGLALLVRDGLVMVIAILLAGVLVSVGQGLWTRSGGGAS